MEKEEDTTIIRITDKGAIMGANMTSNFIVQLIMYRNTYPKATTAELIEKAIQQLEKEISWLKRESDGTVSEDEKKQAFLRFNEDLEQIKKIWKG